MTANTTHEFEPLSMNALWSAEETYSGYAATKTIDGKMWHPIDDEVDTSQMNKNIFTISEDRKIKIPSSFDETKQSIEDNMLKLKFPGTEDSRAALRAALRQLKKERSRYLSRALEEVNDFLESDKHGLMVVLKTEGQPLYEIKPATRRGGYFAARLAGVYSANEATPSEEMAVGFKLLDRAGNLGSIPKNSEITYGGIVEYAGRAPVRSRALLLSA